MADKKPFIDDSKDFKYTLISAQCTFCEHQTNPHYMCEIFGEIPMKYWKDQEQCPHQNTLTPEQWEKHHGIDKDNPL